jgi:nuclear transcription factor Y alpha
MDYAQYPQQQHNTQSAYANPAAENGLVSPTSRSINQHAVQTSPNSTQQPQGQAPNSMYQTQYGVPQQGMQQVPYGMPGIQAAAMAATAAASGSNYPYMHSDPNMPQSSPRMGANSKKDGRQSPRMNSIAQIAGRRLSQVTSPGVPNAPAMMNHAGQRPGVAPPQMPPAQAMQHPQSPEMPHAAVEESPLYVNAKQFHRILKRRVARQRLEEQLRLTSKGRKPYLHESRHNHAMRRPRGPGGRFLTAEEVAAMDRENDAKKGGDDGKSEGGNAAAPSNAGGNKRKTETDSAQPAKKLRTDEDTPDGDDDEDGDS